MVTCVAFSIKFAKTNQKFAEISKFCEKNDYYSELFTSLLTSEAGRSDGVSEPRGRCGRRRSAPMPVNADVVRRRCRNELRRRCRNLGVK